MGKYDEVIALIPHQHPFRFVDDFIAIDELRAEGHYTFKKDQDFYKGHFPDFPVTPGVIITECMAQIGVLGIGIYTLLQTSATNYQDSGVFITSNHIDYIKPVFPEEKIRVVGEKEYFRFSKIKVKVTAYNQRNEVVAKGNIAGIFAPKEQLK